MRTEGQTDMTKLIIDFCNFAKAPKTYASFKCVIQRKYQLVGLHSIGDRTRSTGVMILTGGNLSTQRKP